MATVFVISGPSGAGKGTVISLVRERLQGVATAVSATTRAPRPGERDGREYHFLSRSDFEAAAGRGEFVEWVEYSGNLYGTLHAEVQQHLLDGDDVILEIELQGARAVRRALPDAATVFILPPSMSELAARLRGRGTESDGDIASRLRIAEAEVAAAAEFDHCVVNDSAPRAADEVCEIIMRHRTGDD